MMRYVALLRGINVGGKNRVPMKELKQYTEDLGYEEVVIYINSGNVIFSSNSSVEDIRNKFEAMVLEKFHIDIPVMIVSYDDFLSVHSQVPEWWNQNKEDVNYAIFVLPPHKPESLILEVGLNEEFEQLDYVDQVIFWSAARKTHSKTKWSKVSGLEVGKKITVRNANTFYKLMKLMET